MDELLPKAFGAGLLFLGIWWIRHHHRTRERVRAARLWHAVPGEILGSEVKRHRRGRSTTYEARIRYRYHVAGQSYESSAIVIGGEVRASRSRAQARVGKYPVGSTPDVFYDPKNPAEACLERVHEGSWVELLGGGVGIVLGLLFLFGVLPT